MKGMSRANQRPESQSSAAQNSQKCCTGREAKSKEGNKATKIGLREAPLRTHEQSIQKLKRERERHTGQAPKKREREERESYKSGSASADQIREQIRNPSREEAAGTFSGPHGAFGSIVLRASDIKPLVDCLGIFREAAIGEAISSGTGAEARY